ncbi:MAG TPA: SDR family NAD(P)-dependent oxidoreductase, partial [Gemmatimonadales bacterium]|nr:SDR family NAD(P)-dependent oxidoreductase [Gemmatimonadales bacterium]
MSSGSFDAKTDPVLGTFAANALAGKTCLVSGAASGVGRAIARRFAESGARVVMADIQFEALAAAASAIHGLGVE